MALGRKHVPSQTYKNTSYESFVKCLGYIQHYFSCTAYASAFSGNEF